MSAFENPLNVDPRFRLHQNESSDENFSDSHPPPTPPTLKEYTNSMLTNTDRLFSANKNNQSNSSAPSLINESNRNSQHYPRNGKVPIVKSFQSNDIKRSVKQMLINDHNRDEKVVLKQLNNVQTNSKAVRIPTSPMVPFENVTTTNEQIQSKHFKFHKVPSNESNDIDNVPLLELYKFDDIESKIESKSLKSPSILVGSSVLRVNEDDKYLVTLEDSRISYLNPHQAYVKVAPPMMGSPLAKNGTPLDLSQVSPKNKLASPLFGLEEKKLNDDELKLFSVLQYELKLHGGDVIGENYFAGLDLGNGLSEMEQESESNKESKSNWLTSISKKIFRLGSFSEDAKYFKNFPWAKILYNIDNARSSMSKEEDIENQVTTYEKTNHIERNNTDMFPVHVASSPKLEEFSDNTEYLRRQKLHSVPTH